MAEADTFAANSLRRSRNPKILLIKYEVEMNSSEVILNDYTANLVATIFLIFTIHQSKESFIKPLQKDSTVVF